MFDIYKGRKVFITGHTGFKGSWLAFLLHEAGAEVTGYALPPTSVASHFDQLGLAASIDHRVGDVCDATALSRSIAECQPDFVFHLAAQALVRPSYADPVATFATNVMGSTHLLEAVRNCDSVRSLVYITSDKCYENVEWIWGYRENDPLGGADPYSASKGAAELVFSSYARSFFKHRSTLGCASVRAGNVIGGGDWAVDRIVPDCIRAISSGRPIVLRNPDATRPWQHVLEPLSGYLLLGAQLFNAPIRWSGAWNFGPSSHEVRTVEEVAQHMVERIGTGEICVERQVGQLHEANLLQLNCDKAAQLLRWKPRWGVDKALDATADWYARTLSGEDVAQVTRSQLREYFPELP
jgi:CDP-glucose 4,6-dehydratase